MPTYACTACGSSIELTLEEESWYHEDFQFLCPFCAYQAKKAVEHTLYLEWLEKCEEDDQDRLILAVPKISYIWR